MKTRRHNIFHRCKVEEIRLPLSGGGELQPSDIPEAKQTAGSQEPMEIDQGSKKVQEREDEIEVDFDKLSRKQKELKSAQEYGSCE